MAKPRIHKPVIMREHIKHESGKWKTICVTACLTALGVPFDGFKVTGPLQRPNYMAIMARFGLSARSRKSFMPKGATIGACRSAIAKLNEDAVYFIVVHGNGYCHAMLLNSDGKTLVDTDPRKRDKRKVHSIHAITV
jgi:hypothetical protein